MRRFRRFILQGGMKPFCVKQIHGLADCLFRLRFGLEPEAQKIFLFQNAVPALPVLPHGAHQLHAAALPQSAFTAVFRLIVSLPSAFFSSFFPSVNLCWQCLVISAPRA
jgi:hypothetical protein